MSLCLGCIGMRNTCCVVGHDPQALLHAMLTYLANFSHLRVKSLLTRSIHVRSAESADA